MAAKEEWICTETMQTDLVKLYESDKKKWRIETSKMIREHPSKFSILTVGTTDDGDNLYSFDEFCSHFEASMDNKQLLQLIYDDINVNNDEHIKFIAIHRWVNNVKQQKQSEIIKDHKWLFTKILHVQAAHLDADGSGKVDKEGFFKHFVDKIGFPQYIADAMFADIDKDGDGNLTVMEYTRWKNKHNKPIKLEKFLDKVEKEKDTKTIKKAPVEREKVEEQNDDSKHDLSEAKQSDDTSKVIERDENIEKMKILNEKIASLIKINDNLLNENREKQKENAEMNEKLKELQTKNEELNKEIVDKNSQIVMIKDSESKSIESLQSELNELKTKYESLMIEKNDNEKTLKSQCSESESMIKLLQTENEKLRKKLKKEQNHLDIVLRADTKRIEKEKEMEKQRVVKIAIFDKNDLSKLNVQIEIINSDFYRMKSMMLLAKYDKIADGKFYGFLDFVEKDLSDDALKNVCIKLKIVDKICANKIAPLLSVITKIYMMRLYKMKTGDSMSRNEYKSDRKVVEHFCVWLIRSKSKKMDETESVRVLNDRNDVISGEYAIYNGQILLKQFEGSLAKWCKEYVECNGRHSDSKLEQ